MKCREDYLKVVRKEHMVKEKRKPQDVTLKLSVYSQYESASRMIVSQS